MRISDWSSDVCSSDLEAGAEVVASRAGAPHSQQQMPEAQQGTQPMSEVEVVESSRPELARAAQSGPAAIPRSVAKARVAAHDVNVYYGDNHALKHVDIDIHKNEVVEIGRAHV